MATTVNDDDIMERGDAQLEFPIEKIDVERGTLRSSNATAMAATSEPVKSYPARVLRRCRNIKPFQRSSSKIKVRTTMIRSLNDCPEGYPRLAAFLDSNENFMLYRRFGFLQSRLLLYKQDELRELEARLDRIDQLDAKRDASLLLSRAKDDACGSRRKMLLQEIDVKFKDYASLLVVARDLASFNRPPDRDFRSVKSYFDSQLPLCNIESYIYRHEDIIALKPGREKAWLDTSVEKILQKLNSRIIRYIFSTPDLRAKADDQTRNLILYERTRIELLVSTINLGFIVALLVLPVYILWQLTANAEQKAPPTSLIIGILATFTVAFSGALSAFTRAKRHEILASSAAYCAVLVVFIGNVKQLGPQNAAPF
ncbi:hypothetical protein BKA61DRAFT_736758 [Leptodontidium sp. MPI-SDFR-AT-0119]|nr:hypothetical protein BKA61DRAFT_736758 [Leptodontidium sp. MPI-SDFR-AT-0119]